jgi:hypothetical protein
MTAAGSALAADDIELKTRAMRADWCCFSGISDTELIDVDDIAEKQLGLTIEIDDTHRRYGTLRSPSDRTVPRSINIPDRHIVLDSSLDPEEDPTKEGAYRFAIAHEIGHWYLHRQLISSDKKSSFLCCPCDSKSTLEGEANRFARNLLMPQRNIAPVWVEQFGHSKPYASDRSLRDEIIAIVEDPEERKLVLLREELSSLKHLDVVAAPIAEHFGIPARQARFWLQELGYLSWTRLS